MSVDDYKRKEKLIKKMNDSKWIKAMEFINNHNELDAYNHDDNKYIVHYIPENARKLRKFDFHNIEIRDEEIYFIKYKKVNKHWVEGTKDANRNNNSNNNEKKFADNHIIDKPNDRLILNQIEIEAIEITQKIEHWIPS